MPQPRHTGSTTQGQPLRTHTESADGSPTQSGDGVYSYAPRMHFDSASGKARSSATVKRGLPPATTISSAYVAAAGSGVMHETAQPQPAAIEAGLGERPRLLIVLTVTLLYAALLVMVLSASTGTANVGLAAQAGEDGRWLISKVTPAGLAYDTGVRLNDQVLAVDGISIGDWSAARGPADFESATNVLTVGSDGTTTMVDAAALSGGDRVHRWGYTILGLVFLFVGGPVYVKARQRRAADTFYAFCVASALCLAVAGPAVLGFNWALGLMFVSLVAWAASFAAFFLSFPVPVAQTPRAQILLFGGITGVGLAIVAAYAWVQTGNYDDYAWVRVLALLYVACGVLVGLVRLGWTLRTERNSDIRRQLGLLLVGTGLAVGPTLLLSILPGLVLGRYIVSPLVSSLALGVMPVAFAYAITQHQLLGMRGFMRRGVIYMVMGFSVVLVFALAATSLSRFVPTGWEHEELGILGFGVFVFLLALSFGYIQKRGERLVDRFIYHDSYDYKEELLKFSAQMAAEQNLEMLGGRLVERTCRLMNLSCGVLLLAIDPKEATSTTVLRNRYSTWALHPDGVVSGQWSVDSSGSRFKVQGSRLRVGEVGEAEEPFLLPYVQNGECAEWFLQKLQDELGQLGVNLRGTEGHARLFYLNADPLGSAEWGGGLATSTRANAEMRQSSFLGVPLWTRQRFVGVLCLGAKKTGERFTRDDVSLLTTLGAQAALAIYNAQLYEMREQALLDTITALAHAIEAKDTYTINHCEKITGRAVALAEELGLMRGDVENIRLGSILHDVGKIGVPDAILNKPGKLTSEEYETIKEHSVIGARIVQSVGALAGVVPIVRHHQERYDGKGYPDGLRGEEIPMGARIISVVDAYGAMTEDRIYRKAPGHEVAIAELRRHAGTQFDPDIAEAFIRLLKERPELAEF